MKIVYLDQPSYLPNHAIARLQGIGQLEVFQDRPDSSTARARLESADVAIVEWTDITGEMLSGITRLKCIVLVTTGFGFVDVAAARRNGVTVCNTPEYSRQSVAEHVFAMFLNLGKRLCDARELGRDHKSTYTQHVVGKELFGAELGIVGFGSIGSWVAKIGHGFGMNVSATSRRTPVADGVRPANLDEVLASSDFLALTASVNDSSRGLLDRRRLRLLKSGSIVVNIAANSILDTEYLAEMLKDGRLFGVGLDETPDEPLLSAPNVLSTPGIAWYTQAALDRNAEMFVSTVKAFVDGHPRFVVNPA